jgi:sulfide dehydrogenase cytochrome subunit
MLRLSAAGFLLLAAAAPPPGAASCSGCHAVRAATSVPPIAGRPAPEIVAMLAAFRAGARPASVMNRIAPGFTEAESEAIAAWWSAQPPAQVP